MKGTRLDVTPQMALQEFCQEIYSPSGMLATPYIQGMTRPWNFVHQRVELLIRRLCSYIGPNLTEMFLMYYRVLAYRINIFSVLSLLQFSTYSTEALVQLGVAVLLTFRWPPLGHALCFVWPAYKLLKLLAKGNFKLRSEDFSTTLAVSLLDAVGQILLLFISPDKLSQLMTNIVVELAVALNLAVLAPWLLPFWVTRGLRFVGMFERPLGQALPASLISSYLSPFKVDDKPCPPLKDLPQPVRSNVVQMLRFQDNFVKFYPWCWQAALLGAFYAPHHHRTMLILGAPMAAVVVALELSGWPKWFSLSHLANLELVCHLTYSLLDSYLSAFVSLRAFDLFRACIKKTSRPVEPAPWFLAVHSYDVDTSQTPPPPPPPTVILPTRTRHVKGRKPRPSLPLKSSRKPAIKTRRP